MTGSWPKGFERLILDQTDSTNREADRYIERGGKSAWILAHSQSAGRGSRGRNWISPLGNFAASRVVKICIPPEKAALRTFVAGLALAETFDKLGVSKSEISLKWPNDVLVRKQKIAGILLESSSDENMLTKYLTIGVGVNLVQAPDLSQLRAGAMPATCLEAVLGEKIEPEHFLEVLAPLMERWETELTTHGFAPIKSAWLDRAAGLGQWIALEQGKDRLQGRFVTLSDKGALVLDTETGSKMISAGEIFFPATG